MKSLSLLLLAAVLTLLPRAARAGCPQAGDGCDAVVKLEATLEGAPACVTIDRTEPENGCVCQGTVYVANGCGVELVATDFMWVNNTTTLAAGAVGQFDIDEAALGVHHDELTLDSGGQSFKLKLDYTVEHRVLESASCSAAGEGRGFGGLGVGLGLAALGIMHRRRGARGAANR